MESAGNALMKVTLWSLGISPRANSQKGILCDFVPPIVIIRILAHVLIFITVKVVASIGRCPKAMSATNLQKLLKLNSVAPRSTIFKQVNLQVVLFITLKISNFLEPAISGFVG